MSLKSEKITVLVLNLRPEMRSAIA